MHKLIFSFLFSMTVLGLSAQNIMTPEMLVQLNKVSGKGLTKDGNHLIYSVSNYNIETNSKTSTTYQIPITGGEPQAISDYKSLLNDNHISPDGMYKISTSDVKLKKISGPDHYDDVANSNVMIIDELNYRHWDTWEDGAYSHVMYQSTSDENSEIIDIMGTEPFDCPQKPFGGSEDYIWSPDSKSILYVTKKLSGTSYAVSTNTDIYEYNLESKTTTNLTAEK